MIVLSGADVVLPTHVLSGGTLMIDEGRIAEIRPEPPSSHASSFAFHGHTIVPGFIDVHVHGALGVDSLDAGDAVARMALALPRFGVTAFCPTTVACSPGDLTRVLQQVRACRADAPALAARVLRAHLESNFINADYRGAQPHDHLRTCRLSGGPPESAAVSDAFTGADILDVIDAHAAEVGIVTLAPELDGALDLIARLAALGICVSLGHSGASMDVALTAVAAGARQATHLFNRMPPLHHREPGLAGAVLGSDDVTVEVICDGFHVHPSMVRLAVAAKTPSRVMAISDGTAVAGMPDGSQGTLGCQRITATPRCAVLDDGTVAGSVLTLDEAFRQLTGPMGFSMVEAAVMCASTPARQLGLDGQGRLIEGALADLVVLDHARRVVQTYVGGRLIYARDTTGRNSPTIPTV